MTILLEKAAGSGVFTPDEQDRANVLTAALTAVADAVTALDTQVGEHDGQPVPPPPPPPI